MVRISTIEDIVALETRGFEAYLPNRTPYEILCTTRDRSPDASAIRFINKVDDPSSDEVIPYRELVHRVNQTARFFQSLGITRSDSVAILGGHTPSAQISLWAAELVARVCPINPMLKPDHIAGLMSAANCKAAVVMGENNDVPIWETVVSGLRAAGIQSPIFDCDGSGVSMGSDGAIEQVVAGESTADHATTPDPDDIAALFHTGGTTGAPKLVQHTHQNQAYVARSCALMYDFTGQDRVVNGFPLFHVAGAFVYGLSALCAGAELILPGRLGMRNQSFVDSIWRQVEAYGVTVIGGVPTVISALNTVELDADISTLRLMLSGGSPLPNELAEAFEIKTSKPVRNILGMTETAGCIAVEPFQGERTPGSCGLRLPFSRVQANESGTIEIQGPNVSPGYSRPKEDTGVFLDGGWLSSGDIGHVDEEGRIFATGRSKDIIIRGAHNIDPQAIEDALLSHPSLANAATVGMPDAYAGELPVAFVQIKPGAIDAKATVVEPAAVPKRIEIIEEMPLTPIGKIFKPELRCIATHWAIETTLAEQQLNHPDIRLEILGSQTIRLHAPSDLTDPIRAALTGIPCTVNGLN